MIPFYKNTSMLLLIACISTSCFSGSKLAGNDSVNFTTTIDSLISIIPTVTQTEFNFKKLSSTDYWEWYNSKELIRVSDNFYLNFLSGVKDFNFWKDYQTFYFKCFVDFNDGYFHIVILQRVHNNDIGNMYLVSFDNSGKILNKFLLSKIEKSPDDLLIISSNLDQKELRTTKIYLSLEENGVMQDSIVKTYIIETFNKFVLTQNDSIRVNK